MYCLQDSQPPHILLSMWIQIYVLKGRVLRNTPWRPRKAFIVSIGGKVHPLSQCSWSPIIIFFFIMPFFFSSWFFFHFQGSYAFQKLLQYIHKVMWCIHCTKLPNFTSMSVFNVSHFHSYGDCGVQFKISNSLMCVLRLHFQNHFYIFCSMSYISIMDFFFYANMILNMVYSSQKCRTDFQGPQHCPNENCMRAVDMTTVFLLCMHWKSKGGKNSSFRMSKTFNKFVTWHSPMWTMTHKDFTKLDENRITVRETFILHPCCGKM
jgi:hypothetical protein